MHDTTVAHSKFWQFHHSIHATAAAGNGHLVMTLAGSMHVSKQMMINTKCMDLIGQLNFTCLLKISVIDCLNPTRSGQIWMERHLEMIFNHHTSYSLIFHVSIQISGFPITGCLQQKSCSCTACINFVLSTVNIKL